MLSLISLDVSYPKFRYNYILVKTIHGLGLTLLTFILESNICSLVPLTLIELSSKKNAHNAVVSPIIHKICTICDLKIIK